MLLQGLSVTDLMEIAKANPQIVQSVRDVIEHHQELPFSRFDLRQQYGRCIDASVICREIILSSFCLFVFYYHCEHSVIILAHGDNLLFIIILSSDVLF